MKKVIALILVLTFAIGTPLFAVEKDTKGASAKAYEQASDQSAFNRVGDWFATRGKSPEETKKILAERKAKQAAKRAEKEAKKQAKIAEKKAKKAGKTMQGAGAYKAKGKK
ncbi:MAG: hypothetical protein ABID83_00945 [Candidatus Omnitrophota bacterium]